MPLHLLGKKSWNVYNQDNIEKVRRDEAQAQAREEEQERRMQEADAERRIAVLRGEDPGVVPSAPQVEAPESSLPSSGRDRKRRRIAGEDDTAREIRFAREDVEKASISTAVMRRPTSDAPLTDHAGHISLFPADNSRPEGQKNPEAEAEGAKKKREYEDQYTMRFSNAAGFKQGLENPWYSSNAGPNGSSDVQMGKDVWGNEDPRRREREKVRIDANDPLAVMRKGVTQLRKAEEGRKQWNEEREKELAALKAAERDQRRRKREDGEDELENFSLDAGSGERKHRHRQHHSHGYGRRSKSRERSRSREGHLRHSRSHKDRGSRRRGGGLMSTREEGRVPGWVNAPGKRYSAQFAST